MPVQIHGKSYVTVAERLAELHDGDRKIVIVTDIVPGIEGHVTVRATITIDDNTFSGHASSNLSGGGIEGQAPIEVAETSAVGRALAFAGFSTDAGIASAEEMQRGERNDGRPGSDARELPLADRQAAEKPTEKATDKTGATQAWKGFWARSHDLGLATQKEVHELFGLEHREGALRQRAEELAQSDKLTLAAAIGSLRIEMEALSAAGKKVAK